MGGRWSFHLEVSTKRWCLKDTLLWGVCNVVSIREAMAGDRRPGVPWDEAPPAREGTDRVIRAQGRMA